MDPRTQELVTQLHERPHDADALNAVRAHLTLRRDLRTLAEVLRWWSRKAPDAKAASAALTEAARLLHTAGEDPMRVVELLELAIAADPMAVHATATAEAILLRASLPARFDRLLEQQVAALSSEGRQGAARRLLLVRLGRMRLEHRGDPQGAIDALTLVTETPHPDREAVLLLARSYEARAEVSDDAVQAELDREHARGLVAALCGTLDSGVTHLGSRFPLPPAPPAADRSRVALLSELEGAQRHDARARSGGGVSKPYAVRPTPAQRAPFEAQETRKDPLPRRQPSARPLGFSGGAALAAAAGLEPAYGSAAVTPVAALATPTAPSLFTESELSERRAEQPDQADEDDEDDEDDEEDDGRLPSVGIAELVADDRAPGLRRGRQVVEIIRSDRGRVVGSDQLRRLASRWRSHAFSVWRIPSGAVVRLHAPLSGQLHKLDGMQPVAESQRTMRLRHDEFVELAAGHVLYYVRVRSLRDAPHAQRGALPWRRMGAFVAAALLLHMVALGALLGLQSMGVELRVDEQTAQEIFAEGTLQADKPKLANKRPKPVKLRPREEAPAPTALPRSLSKHVRYTRRASEPTTAGLLAALSKPTESVADMVTSIDAVKGKAPSSVLALGGLLAATSDGSLQMATASRAVETAGGSEAKSALARLSKRSHGGAVRGKVRGIESLAKVQGSLSRSAVMEAINKKLGRIQGCYEKALTQTPNLSGQIRFAWTVNASGDVSGVSEAGSSLGSSAVSSCIASVIRSMRFPRPSGGAVKITFPFIFQRAT